MSKFWVRVGIVIVTLLLLTILILQNVVMVNIQLLFWSFPLPLIVVMLFFFIGGFIVGLVVAGAALFSRVNR
ncbi:MAG: LapA family protein [Brevinematales bacterium]